MAGLTMKWTIPFLLHCSEAKLIENIWNDIVNNRTWINNNQWHKKNTIQWKIINIHGHVLSRAPIQERKWVEKPKRFASSHWETECTLHVVHKLSQIAYSVDSHHCGLFLFGYPKLAFYLPSACNICRLRYFRMIVTYWFDNDNCIIFHVFSLKIC